MTSRVRLPNAAATSGVVVFLLGMASLLAAGGVATSFDRSHIAPAGTSVQPTGALPLSSALTNCTNGTGYTQLTATTQTSWAGTGDPRGYAPLNVGWTVSVNGGLPPYNITLTVNLSPRTVDIGHGPTGNYTFQNPGEFDVDLTVRDAAPDCQSLGQGAFAAYVWGSGGPNPVHITASALSGTAPLHDHFSLTVVGLTGPFNATWDDQLGNVGWGTQFNDTLWMAGSGLGIGACVTNATGAEFGCGTVYVNVTGPGILTLEGTPQNATSPYEAHAWANLSLLNLTSGPLQYTYYWSAGGSAGAVGNISAPQYPVTVNLSASPAAQVIELNATLSDRYDVPVSASLVVDVSAGGRVLGWSFVYFMIEPGNGSLPSPQPVLSYSVSPATGPAPLTVTITATALGGSPLYSNLDFGTVGGGTLLGNGTRLPAWWGNVTAWNGSARSFVHVFSTPGDFTIIGEVVDAAGGSSIVLAPVSVLAPALPKPLDVQPRMVGGVTPGGVAHFVVNVSGGTAPYTIQWAFGDGALGTSDAGGTAVHQFPGPGTYVPKVSVEDGRGKWVNSTLPAVTIPPPSTSTAFGIGGPGASVLAVGVAFAAGCWGYYRYRKRLRDEGRRLVAEVSEGTGQGRTGSTRELRGT